MSSIESTQTQKPAPVFISVTRLRLKSPLYLPVFMWNNFLIIWQTINTPGFLSGKLLIDTHQTFWTMTAWDEQAAMKIFRNSGTHRSIMPKIQDWCDQASVVHWRQAETSLPDWAEVHQRLITDGFLTKLSHPSAAHLDRNIPAPASTKALLLQPLRTKTPLIVKA
jgi:hypothetical protein